LFDITILGSGTSTGVPLIGCDCAVCTSTDDKNKRLRTSIKIQSKTTTVVIDTTPDFRYQMLRTQTTKIDAIVFTHPHRDHYAGLDDIRPFNFFSKKSMPIYANEITQTAIKRDFFYAFEKDGKPYVYNCGKTDFLEFATDDIKELGQGKIPSQNVNIELKYFWVTNYGVIFKIVFIFLIGIMIFYFFRWRFYRQP
jgi:phosphoribosyl 1,2-cyclic phosphodiesterase